jgi:hypothetical protein
MAVDNMSMRAKFEDVKYDIKALEFHAQKFVSGSTYILAKQCYQHWALQQAKTAYEVFKEETNVNNS